MHFVRGWRRLSIELERMKKQILQPPADTTELLKRSWYLEQVRSAPLSELVVNVDQLKSHFVQLTDIVTYSHNDVIRSSLLFSGPDQIVPMLDTSAEVSSNLKKKKKQHFRFLQRQNWSKIWFLFGKMCQYYSFKVYISVLRSKSVTILVF